MYLNDPDGIQNELHYGIEQIGRDGQLRPKELRRPRKMDQWPDVLETDNNAYLGEPCLGP